MYNGKHRMDEVGSLRWSDDDCLTSERVSKMIQQEIESRYNVPDCEQ